MCGLFATANQLHVLAGSELRDYTALQQMLGKLRNIIGRSSSAKSRMPALPAGERVYAIGDIHGRFDLFEHLIATIDADDGARSRAHTTIILLGDLIDRGPASASVVARARELASTRSMHIIQGNHEEMFLHSRTRPAVLKEFLRFGGRETIASYGVPADAIERNDPAELQQLIQDMVPEADFSFMEDFEKMVRMGDYLFVHAGIRPNSRLDMQRGEDCRWIREPFLSDERDYGFVVIHGHTITEEPVVRSNRIGIDTGAVRFGTLTALGLQGTDRWFLQARQTGENCIETAEIAA